MGSNVSGNDRQINSRTENPQKIDYAGEDAYFLYNNLELELINDIQNQKQLKFFNGDGSAKTIQLRHASRLKINNRKGIEDYSYITINKSDKSKIKNFEIKTIKPDGSVIKFDSTQIFHASIPFSVDSIYNVNLIRYVIPGVEPGDIIETDYSCNYPGYFADLLHGKSFPQTHLPSLQTNYRIIVPAPYKIFYKCYNNYKEPVIVTDSIKVVCTFSSDSTIAIKDNSFACLEKELPYFYYSIEYMKDDLGESFKLANIYNEFFRYANSPLSFSDPNKVKRWIKLNLKDYKEENKYQQFERLYTSLMDNFEIDETASSLDFSNHKIPRKFLYCFYSEMFNYLEIDHFLCLAKNKYDGEIDLNFIRKNEFTDFLLFYYDNDSNKVLIYPHEELKKYNLNEFPSRLNGTSAILVKQAKRNEKKNKYLNSPVSADSLLDIRSIYLSRGDYRSNYYYRQRIIGVNLGQDESSYVSTMIFSGLSYTDNRPVYSKLFERKENVSTFLKGFEKGRDFFKVDSIHPRSENKWIPYNYSVSMYGKLGRFYDIINDTTLIISPKEILDNNKIEYNKQYRNLDILLPYAYTDIQDLIIEFQQPFEIINKDALSKHIENPLGSYKFELIPVEGNKLQLTSTYVIKSDLIEKTAFTNLDEINDVSSQLSNSRIILKIKK